MHRRRLLRIVGTWATMAGGLPLAGCAGGDPGTPTEDGDAPRTTQASPEPATATDSATDTPDPEPVELRVGESHVTDAGWSVALEDARLRRSVAARGTVHTDVVATSEGQFVVVDVAVEGDGPHPSDLPLAVSMDGTVERARHVRRVSTTGAGGDGGTVGIPVRAERTPGRAAVVWNRPDEPPVQWRLPDDVVGRFAARPDFDVERFEVPDRAPPEGSIEATLEVSNAGERDGRFLAEFGTATLSDQPEVAVDVPSGETTVSHPSLVAHFIEADEMEVVLRWPGGEERRTVRREE